MTDPEKNSVVTKLMNSLPIKTSSNGEELIVYHRKGNPGKYEEIARLNWDHAVGLYLNVKKEVEGTLFLKEKGKVV